jgi:hypothetical protein
MIDKIKLMNDNFNPDYILNNLRWKAVENDNLPNKKMLQARLYNDLKDKRKIMGLAILLTENLNTKTYSISIQGSIRKWYYKCNSRKDLSYTDFLDSINLLSIKLGLKQDVIWDTFKITNLELGITLLLKAEFHNIMDCFVKYQNAIRDNKFETTVYFKFKNYKILLYDKFIEINKGKIWGKNEKNIFNKFHFLRFEISVTKVSGTNFKNKYDTLELLKCNWNEIPKILYNYLDKIEFVDLISKEKKTETVTRIDFLNKLCFLGIKSNGIHKTIMDFNKLEIPNNKSKYFKDLMGIYKSNISTDRDYKAEILGELRKKTDRLYNKSNNRYINSV